MTNKKTMMRFYTIVDFEQEEAFLRQQHQQGWKLKNYIMPFWYRFERTEPEDVVYRLDYCDTASRGEDYYQMFRDYGWEYMFCRCKWEYFRKPVIEMEKAEDSEIFSDSASKLAMVERVIKQRFLPLLILFVTIVIPQFFMWNIGTPPVSSFERFFAVLWTLLLAVYIFLISFIFWRYRKLKRKYQKF